MARNLARLESRIAGLTEHHARRGVFDRHGVLKSSVGVEAKMIGDVLGEGRRLFEMMQAQRAQTPVAPDGSVTYIACLADGTPAFAAAVPVREAPATPADHEIERDRPPAAPEGAATERSSDADPSVLAGPEIDREGAPQAPETPSEAPRLPLRRTPAWWE